MKIIIQKNGRMMVQWRGFWCGFQDNIGGILGGAVSYSQLTHFAEHCVFLNFPDEILIIKSNNLNVGQGNAITVWQNIFEMQKNLFRGTTSLGVRLWTQENKCCRCVLDRGYTWHSSSSSSSSSWSMQPSTSSSFLLLIRMMIRCVESIWTGCSGEGTPARAQKRTTPLEFQCQDPESTSQSGLSSSSTFSFPWYRTNILLGFLALTWTRATLVWTQRQQSEVEGITSTR